MRVDAADAVPHRDTNITVLRPTLVGKGRAMTNPEDVAPSADPRKDPDEWTTGDEPMTGPQASYLQTLCREAGREFDPDLSKSDASKLIDELQGQTGRGASGTTDS